MNTLFLLNSSDFKTAEGQLQFTKTKNLTFVLFYSTKCKYCGPAREAFNFVASQYAQSNVKFGIINVTQNPSLPQLSKDTKTPIQYVPFLIAFFNGVPISVYSSQYTQQNISKFIQQCYSTIKVDSFGSKKQEAESEADIPKFATGIPYCEEGVCYLSFDGAYKSTAS